METIKRIILIALIAVMTLTTAAQDSKGGSLNERLYKAKVRELVYRLHITPEQQKKFEPIYRRYCEEMSALWAERKRPIPPSTSSDAVAIERRRMEMQQRAQSIRIKYLDELGAVLNAQQVGRFFEVESIIQQKLKERKEKARGQ